jgi:hypothetical protein
MAHDESITTPPTIELTGTSGNIFSILHQAADYLRSQERPDAYIETLFNAILASGSFVSALRVITAHTGISFTHRGHRYPDLGRN